ncbi:MAG: transposase [bacterium]|nr:transposase [bacterium]
MTNKDILDYKIFYRRNLPHYQPESGIFFITYRLNFDLPSEIVEKLIQQKQEYAKRKSVSKNKDEKSIKLDFEKQQFYFVDNYLGLCKNGPKYLSDSNIAQIVKDSLFFMNKKQYELYCFCVMPNHVHILIMPQEQKSGSFYSFAEILKGHKGSTARKANIFLNKTGSFWHKESYDHLVRSQQEFEDTVWYIINNPVKAHLTDDYRKWNHTWIAEYVKKEMGL